MGLRTDHDTRLWTHQPRQCLSPEGRLLTWYTSESDIGVRRQMFRLGNRALNDDLGEATRIAWGGPPD